MSSSPMSSYPFFFQWFYRSLLKTIQAQNYMFTRFPLLKITQWVGELLPQDNNSQQADDHQVIGSIKIHGSWYTTGFLKQYIMSKQNHLLFTLYVIEANKWLCQMLVFIQPFHNNIIATGKTNWLLNCLFLH